jgi:CDP-glucose 4,6-dehydratase
VVVNVTTDKCYENHGRAGDPVRPFTENDPLGGHDPYSASKAASELVAAAYRSSFFSGDDAPAVATARAGNVFGGGDWGEDRLIPDVMRAALSGEPVAIRNPGAVRPWQHVLNPLHGYLTLAEALWNDRSLAAAYNFGPAPADVLPVSELVDRLLAGWGDDVAVETDPGPHPAEAAVLSLDSGRALERLGWQPVWDLDAGLAATAEWYRGLGGATNVRELTLGQVAAFSAAAASGGADR